MLFQKTILFTIFFITLIIAGYCQNLEEIGVKKGVKLNGSVNLNTVGYYAHGIDQRRDPFNWFITGNLNVNLFGYSAPFSFSYSNADKNFSQPFNQFSFQPTYKWVRTYIGYNSMTFSPYTLSGHVFFGGGAELTPGKWRIATMYGRLRKAVEFNLNDSLQYNNASYKRMGYGLKVGYENNGDIVSANIFAAKDDVFSIPFVLPESQLSPQQNVAASFQFRKKLLTKIFIEAEYAISAFNKDLRATGNESDSVIAATHNLIKNLLPENATSRYYDALNASIGYQANWYAVRIKYERIAPEYQTMGAYYFNNDMENITLAPTFRLFQSKLNLSANAGVQQNNLDEARNTTTRRWVGALNANYVPNAKWNFSGNYSNFSSYTNIRPQQDPFFRNNLDTLNFYQVSQTMTGMVMRNLGGKNNPQSIMVNLSYQQASDRSTSDGATQLSDFKSMNVSYSYSITPSNTTLALSANVYENNAAGIKSLYWGPTLSATKSLYDKTLRASLASSYNETSGSNIQSSPVLNNRLSISFSPKPKETGGNSPHNLSLGVNLLSRLKSTDQQKKYTELTGTVNYTYSF